VDKQTSFDSSSLDSSTSSSLSQLEQAKEDALSYINSLDLSLYREAERATLNEAINEAKSALNEKQITIERINSIVSSLKVLVSSLKTDAQYSEEEKTAAEKAMSEKKTELLKKVEFNDIKQYRSEEENKIVEAQVSLKKQINDATTLEELEVISFTSYLSLISSLKTNASYTMEEMTKFPLASRWSLVNEHASSWSLTSNGIKANTIGYLIADGGTYDVSGTTLAFTVDSSDYPGIAGIMLSRPNTTGDNDGLDGYLANIVHNASGDNFVQIWYLNNAYNSKGFAICTYIGGWVYPNNLMGTSIRISFENGLASIFDANEYAEKGDTATRTDVDLTNNGAYSLYEGSDFHPSILQWEGDKTVDVKFDLLEKTKGDNINGVAQMKGFASAYISSIDKTLYREAEQTSIDEAIALYNSSIVDKGYEEIETALDTLKATIQVLKTDAAYTKEEEAKNIAKVIEKRIKSTFYYEKAAYSDDNASLAEAVIAEARTEMEKMTTVDEVNAFDLTSYVTRIAAIASNASEVANSIVNDPDPSAWNLCAEHARSWTYSYPSIVQVSDDYVGWAMSKPSFNDFDLVFEVNSTSPDFSPNGLGILARASHHGTSHSLDGYLIQLVPNGGNQFVQVFYLSDAFSDDSTAFKCDYLGGGVFTKKVYGTAFRMSFSGSTLSIYEESEYEAGNTTAPISFDLGIGGHQVYTSGKMGILNWTSGNSAPATVPTSFYFKRIVKK
jgi:hypothetical protein